MSVSIMICGDTVPTESNIKEFSDGDRKSLVSDALWEKLLDVDFRFYNLEVPL